MNQEVCSLEKELEKFTAIRDKNNATNDGK